jgi:hypothetical protein
MGASPRIDLAAERERIASDFFEPQLAALNLSPAAIASFDEESLRAALERVNDAIAHVDQFGAISLRMTADAGWVVAKVTGESHIQVGALPLLLQRKQLILGRIAELAGSRQVQTLSELVAQIGDPELRARLQAELEELRRKTDFIFDEQQQVAAQQRAEDRRLADEETRQRLKVELFERRSVVWQRWFERESVATIMGAVLLVGLVAALVVAMFTGTTVPELISNAFLIILGYFFGQASGRTLGGGARTTTSGAEPSSTDAD